MYMCICVYIYIYIYIYICSGTRPAWKGGTLLSLEEKAPAKHKNLPLYARFAVYTMLWRVRESDNRAGARVPDTPRTTGIRCAGVVSCMLFV